MTLEQIALRAERYAHEALAVGVEYHLGGGANRAKTSVPWKPFLNKSGETRLGCDCSAWVCWISGVDKNTNGYWYNTDAIKTDANGAQKRWKKLDAPARGCVAVYGGHCDAEGHFKVGHCAIVLDPVSQTIVDSSGSRDGIYVHKDDKAKFFKRPDVVFCCPIEAEP